MTGDVVDMMKEMCAVLDGTVSRWITVLFKFADSAPHCLVELQDIGLHQVALYHAHRVDDDQSWTSRGMVE